MTRADALAVPCAECYAPAGQPCRTNYEGQTHTERQRSADLGALERGTCGLCGAPMVRGSVLDAPVDAWHYQEADAAVCPVMPDPHQDWNNYAAAVNLGLSPGHPGIEHFRPALDPTRVCPECAQGKHQNCTLTIPGEGLELHPCACMAAKHQEAAA